MLLFIVFNCLHTIWQHFRKRLIYKRLWYTAQLEQNHRMQNHSSPKWLSSLVGYSSNKSLFYILESINNSKLYECICVICSRLTKSIWSISIQPTIQPSSQPTKQPSNQPNIRIKWKVVETFTKHIVVTCMAKNLLKQGQKSQQANEP